MKALLSSILPPALVVWVSFAAVELRDLETARGRQSANWTADVILPASSKLGGCAVGDVDPEHPGNEVVSVSIKGEVHVSRGYKNGERWVTEQIADAPGELIQCAVGDADSKRDGNEIVAVGMKAGTEDDGGPGTALLFSRGEAGWEARTLLDDSALVHACAIADVDPGQDGDEIVVAGFGRKVWVVANGGETREVACELDGAAKSLYPFESGRSGNPGDGGTGVAVACANGELVLVQRIGDAWTKRVLTTAPAGLARLGGAGSQLIVARDDGKLAIVEPDGTVRVIYSESEKLRGAVLADLDPGTPGLEAATVGYLHQMTVLHQEAGEWIPEVVFVDDARLHHLAVGELVESSPGPELVACGYSGRLILAARRSE